MSSHKRDSLFMEHTEISPERSAAEICRELVAAGATQISTDYEGGKIKGLRWVMRSHGKDVLFSMPARVEPIHKLLLRRSSGGSGVREKVERVAWRQLLRWVQAQIAMIQTGMVDNAEVFFPYLVHHKTGSTVWELFRDTELKALPAPEEKPS